MKKNVAIEYEVSRSRHRRQASIVAVGAGESLSWWAVLLKAVLAGISVASAAK